MKLLSQRLSGVFRITVILALLTLVSTAFAQDAAPAAEPAAEAPPYESLEKFAESPGYAVFTINNVWMMVAAALVFFMNLGFGCVESGLTRSKNTANIMFKNTIVPCIGIVTYALVGFNLMYPGGDGGGWFGFAGFGISVTDPVAGLTDAYNAGYTYWTDFLYQAMFAATAATIVSGAVAERIKLSSFMVFTVLIVTISYPITGMWKWGNGWLNTMETPFYDFAGSTIVHSVGGWGALAGIILIGPRLGKYSKDGRALPLLGHSIPLATIGVFILWLGWFGFIGGSVLSANPGAVSLVLVTTALAAATGGLGATFTSWFMQKRPDVSMALNGILAGLVAITAGADQMNPNEAMIIGFIGGILVVFSVMFFDKLKLDDPVGATSVHLVNGIWGTLAVGLFGNLKGGAQIVSQLKGIISIGLFTFIFCLVAFFLIKMVMGLRVSAEEETEGLDIGEHGNEAYPDFTAAHK